MGIEQLHGQWVAKVTYPGVHLSQLPHKISSLLLDTNGILHEIAQKVYAYGKGENEAQKVIVETSTKEQLEAMYTTELCNKLAQLVVSVNPTHAFVIAIDGVAPPAKLRQQRQRRYKEANGKTEDGSKHFNSVCITPGTEFMTRIDNVISSWIATNRERLPPIVVYSSHMVHGEGEHKIFKLIRDGVIPEGEGMHAVYGLDADLYMLSLLSPFRDRIVLVREDLRSVVSIPALASGIDNELNGRYLPTKVDLGIPKNLAIQDFVVLVYFAGNDFLPRLFAFNDMGLLMANMISRYQFAVNEKRATLVNPDGTINWVVLSEFLTRMAAIEEDLLKEKASYGFLFPSRLLDSCSTREELEVFRANPYVPKYRVTAFDFKRFRGLWYWNCFVPKTQFGQNLAKDEKFNIVNVSDVNSMCSYYLYGLQWILHYYRGVIGGPHYTEKPPSEEVPVALDFMYPYRYAPLLADLARVGDEHAKSGDDLPINIEISECYIGAHHQLVAVIPPAFRSYIPQAQRALVINAGALADLCPISFIVENEGRHNAHHPVLILPELDLDRLVAEVDKTLKRKLMGGKEYVTIPFKEAEDWVSIRESAPVIPGLSRYPRGVHMRPEGGKEESYRPAGGRGRSGRGPGGPGRGRGGHHSTGRGTHTTPERRHRDPSAPRTESGAPHSGRGAGGAGRGGRFPSARGGGRGRGQGRGAPPPTQESTPQPSGLPPEKHVASARPAPQRSVGAYRGRVSTTTTQLM